MKKHRTGRWMLYFGMLLLLIGIIGGNAIMEVFNETNGMISTGKILVEARTKGGAKKALSSDKIKALKERLPNQMVFFTVKPGKQQYVEHTRESHTADLLGIDFGYSMLHSIEFLQGSSFPAALNVKNPRIALLSEDFAWKRFKTTDINGLTIEIYGIPFTIIGVFQIQKSILHTLARIKIPEILMPAETMLELDSEAYIDSFQIPTKENGTLNRVFAALRQADIDETAVTVTDFNNHERLMRQKPQIIVFIMGLATIFYLGRKALFLLKQIAVVIRKMRINDGLTQGIRENAGFVVHRLLLILAALVGMVLIWRLSAFQMIIPPQYHPGQSLDMHQYIRLFQDGLQNAFSGISADASTPQRLLQAAQRLTNIMFFTTSIAGPALCMAGIKNTKSECFDAGQNVSKAGLAYIVLLMMVTAMLWLLGLKPAIQINGVLLLWAYITAGFIPYKHTKVN